MKRDDIDVDVEAGVDIDSYLAVYSAFQRQFRYCLVV